MAAAVSEWGGAAWDLFAIDPGPVESGWVAMEGNTIHLSGISNNDELLRCVEIIDGDLAIEKIASYGMPVGASIFETCVWTGRMIQAFDKPDAVIRVTRNEVKNHLCGSSKAKDPNVRQRLIDLFGEPGRKANPGPTYGLSGDMWAALGVAATVRGLQ